MLSSHTVFSVLDVWEDKESAKRISPAFSSTLKLGIMRTKGTGEM